MRFKTIKIRNLGPFSKYRADFSGNLIGILGANGSGKSTLVELLYSAITGDFRKYSNLLDFVRDLPGGDKASSGSCEVVFEHGGADYTVRRILTVVRSQKKIKATQSAVFKSEGHEDVKGVRLVDAELHGLLGEDLSLLGQFAFVEQSAISAIVDSDSSERTRCLHVLFGLRKFEKLWSLLGDEIRSIPELSSADDLSSLNVERCELSSAHTEAKLSIDKLQLDLTGMDVVSAESDITTWESLSDLRDTVVSVDAAFNQAGAYLRQVEAEHQEQLSKAKELGSQVEKAKPAYVRAKNFLDEAQYKLWAIKRKTEIEVMVSQIIEEGKKLKAPVKPIESWSDAEEAELSSVSAKFNISADFVKEHSALLFNSGTAIAVKCPTCGQEIKDLAADLLKHKSVVEALLPFCRDNKARKSLINKKLASYDKDYAVFNERSSQIIQRGARIAEEYADISAKCPKDADAYSESACAKERSFVAEFQAVIAASDAADNVLLSLNAKVDRYCTELESAKVICERVRIRLAGINDRAVGLDAERIFHCRAIIKLASDKRIELAHASERALQLNFQVVRIDERIASAKVLFSQIEQANFLRKTLSDSRDVFHRDNLPRLLAKRYLMAIDSQLQRFLSIMQSSFTSQIESGPDGYSFRCLFGDTSQREAASLSGGEKVRFSVSLLLAINDVLSTRLGVLSLDEPTSQLDDDSVQQFIDVLSSVQQYAASAGVQIFMVTHSHQLVGSFDQCIRLDKS